MTAQTKTMAAAGQLPYQPEIDGLRAIAVLSVFLFHLDHRLLPGGFVGVDVFFVISGYLITSIIYRDLIKGEFSFARFYQRRIARIFPAFFLVALVTLAVASVVYLPQDFASAGANLVAAALSVANLKYMLQGNYFEISPDAQPFLHYWSLSVEEQFYLIFPALLWVVCKYFRPHLVPVLVGLGITSFALCVWLTYHNPVWAFYLLPTRAWELGIGAYLAVVLSSGSRLTCLMRPEVFAVGLGLVLASFWVVNEGSNFPGWMALLPVTGTALMIGASPSGDSWAKRALSHTAMVYVGRMSYSLYLWHWPVFSLIDYQFYEAPAAARVGGKILLSFGLAALTLRLFEKPTRRALNERSHVRLAYAVMSALIVTGVLAGWTVRKEFYLNAIATSVASGGLVYYGPPEGPKVVLIGDSNGSMYARALRDYCKNACSQFNVLSVAAGDSLPSATGNSGQLWQDTVTAVSRIQPDSVVIANDWAVKLKGSRERVPLAVRQLSQHTDQIVIIEQPPALPEEASRERIRSGHLGPFRENDELREQRLAVNAYLSSLRSDTVQVVGVEGEFELPDGTLVLKDARGRHLYQDKVHLSDYGARRVTALVGNTIGY